MERYRLTDRILAREKPVGERAIDDRNFLPSRAISIGDAATAIPLVVLAIALPMSRDARSGRALLAFMIAVGAASSLAIVAWTLALFCACSE